MCRMPLYLCSSCNTALEAALSDQHSLISEMHRETGTSLLVACFMQNHTNAYTSVLSFVFYSQLHPTLHLSVINKSFVLLVFLCTFISNKSFSYGTTKKTFPNVPSHHPRISVTMGSKTVTGSFSNQY